MGIFFAKFRNGEVKQFDVAPKTVEKTCRNTSLTQI